MKTLKKGQWIECEDGIGMVLSVHECYVEKYTPGYISGLKKLGAPGYTVCVYKILANFDGKIRKRNIVKSLNIDYCDEISDKYQSIIDRISKEYPAEYAKFLKLDGNKKVVNFIRLFFMRNEGLNLKKLKAEIDALNIKIKKPFTFDDFIDASASFENQTDFLMFDKNVYLSLSDFYITLENHDYATKNKKTLFTSISMSIQAKENDSN